MAAKDIIVGIDIGGTKIMTGAINAQGDMLCDPVQVPTRGSSSAEIIFNTIVTTVDQIVEQLDIEYADLQGIGIGCTGPLDVHKGIIMQCPQLPSMHFFPLKKSMKEHFGVPVDVNNDANCLIYGETKFGVGAGKKNVLGFTLGTGIGCAVILHGQIVNGSRSAAGEIWASPYGEGTIEDFISGVGVTRIYKEISGVEKSALEVGRQATLGDEQALMAWRQFGEHLSVPMAWSINLMDPEIVILGGSITNAYPHFQTTLHECLNARICPVPGQWPKVELASLGEHAGFIGAACLMIK